MSSSLKLQKLQHTRLPFPSLSPRVCLNSCPLSQWFLISDYLWCLISNHLIHFWPHLSCPQSFPVSGSFPMSQLFASGGQRIGNSASASVFPLNIQSWLSLRLTGLISLLSKGLSSVFSSTTVRKYLFIGSQPSLLFNSHIHKWLLEKP